MKDSKDLDRRLAAVPLFATLSRRQRGKLLDTSKVVTHPAGHEIAKEGEGARALHLILTGSAMVSVGGQEVRTLGDGDYFGEISLIDGKGRSASVTATDQLEVLAIEHLAFNKVIHDDPELSRALLITLCARLREAEQG